MAAGTEGSCATRDVGLCWTAPCRALMGRGRTEAPKEHEGVMTAATGSRDRVNHRVVVSRRGDPDGLLVVEEPRPKPDPNEARVQVVAAGVSAYDVMLRSSRFPGFPRVPYTPGEDIVGVIDAVGSDVSDVEVGQRVGGWTFGDGGGYTEFICRPVDQLVPVPANLDSVKAVAVTINYLTAHLALHTTAHLHSGERMLVHGGAGGVGSALLQLGALAGVEMFATTSPGNKELVASFGATPIDYHSCDFVGRIKALTGDGVDAVVDLVGGPRQLWRSYRCLRPGGRLVMLGMAAANRHGTKVIPPSLAVVGLLKLLPDGKTVPLSPGLDTYPSEHERWYADTLSGLYDLAATGKLDPVVAARIPLTDAAEAHRRFERGGHAGKYVLISNGPERDHDESVS